MDLHLFAPLPAGQQQAAIRPGIDAVHILHGNFFRPAGGQVKRDQDHGSVVVPCGANQPVSGYEQPVQIPHVLPVPVILHHVVPVQLRHVALLCRHPAVREPGLPHKAALDLAALLLLNLVILQGVQLALPREPAHRLGAGVPFLGHNLFRGRGFAFQQVFHGFTAFRIDRQLLLLSVQIGGHSRIRHKHVGDIVLRESVAVPEVNQRPVPGRGQRRHAARHQQRRDQQPDCNSFHSSVSSFASSGAAPGYRIIVIPSRIRSSGSKDT